MQIDVHGPRGFVNIYVYENRLNRFNAESWGEKRQLAKMRSWAAVPYSAPLANSS